MTDTTCFICLFSNCVCTLKRVIGSGETLERKTALFLEKNGVLKFGKPKQPMRGDTEKRTGSLQSTGILMLTCRSKELAEVPSSKQWCSTGQQFLDVIGMCVAFQKATMVHLQKHFNSSKVHFLKANFPIFPYFILCLDSRPETLLEQEIWIPFIWD